MGRKKTASKGQLILKIHFGILNSSKKIDLTTMIVVELFCLLFGKIEDKKGTSKLTDL